MAAEKKFRPRSATNTVEGTTFVNGEVPDTLKDDEEIDKAELTTGGDSNEDTQIEEDSTEITASNEEKPEDTDLEDDSPVVFKDTEEKPLVEKNVKVCLTENHSCVIGGEHYYFVKGKQCSVPVNVKSILRQAGLLAPL